jgi:hypothetical protein
MQQNFSRRRLLIGGGAFALPGMGGSYLSSHDPRVLLGLGASKKVDWLEIKWPLPSGKVQRLTDLRAEQYLTIVEGRPLVYAVSVSPCMEQIHASSSSAGKPTLWR